MKCRFWYLHGSNNCRVFSKIFALKHINYSPSIFLRLWNNEWKSSYAQWQSHILQFDLIIFFSYRQWLEFHAPWFLKFFYYFVLLCIYRNHCNDAKTIILLKIFKKILRIGSLLDFEYNVAHHMFDTYYIVYIMLSVIFEQMKRQ